MTNFEALIDKRTMKKKTMIVLMSAFLLLSAFSCGGGNKANSTSEQDEKTVVNVPQFDADRIVVNKCPYSGYTVVTATA